ncbi:MAG: hypothetical protein ACXACY_21745 [Candidatus Hodarchaeales archaeon]|jgi:hypothetical protein
MTEKIKEALKKLPYLRTLLMWCDANMEDDVEFNVRIMWIAEEFDYNMGDIHAESIKDLGNHVAIQSLISGKMENINTRDNVKTYTKLGLIKVDRCCFSIKYKDIVNPINETYVLSINHMDYNSRKLTKEQLAKYLDEIDTLFGETETPNNYNKMEALYSVFKSPRMAEPMDGYTVTMQFVQKKNNQEDDVDTFLAKCNTDFEKIINLYLDYLWKANKENKDLKYVYSFVSWFNKNKHLWGEEIEESEEEIDLFNSTHQEILRIFSNISEPIIKYYRKLKRM